MADLKLDSVCKRFGAVTVIEDLSLSIEDGEFAVLVGPSGCGKSTLLRMIAGLEHITDGDLFIGGVRANDIPPQKRDISMVFQSYALFPHMTVKNNISFGPDVRGEAKDETAARISKAAEILNMEDYLHRRPGQLSGGQRQRVAMGRAIVRDPKVFLFDEPLSNLDAKLRIQMRTEIKALHQKLGSTAVYVTHDQIEAMTMADRIVVMNKGGIEQVGGPLDLYDRPANLFVAGFIGSPAMSFLKAETAPDGPAAVLADGAKVPVSVSSQAGAGRAVTLGIRPESCRRDPEGPITLSVKVVEPTGPEIHVFGAVAGEDVRVVLRGRDLPRPGDEIRLSAAAEDVHLFDPESGRRFA